ncbi:hypothetical protein D3C77_581150 [compost metagenome]
MYRHLYTAGDFADQLIVHRMARLRAIQVDQMNKRAALRFPSFGNLNRVVVIYRLTSIIALNEADTFASPDIDRRVNDK